MHYTYCLVESIWISEKSVLLPLSKVVVPVPLKFTDFVNSVVVAM